MKVAIVGYRNFNDYKILKERIDELMINITTIISGGCVGTDKLAERYAKEKNIPTVIHYPDWSKFGLKAGILRNTKIVEDAEYVIAFLSKESKGTYDTINKAKTKGIPMTIYNI